MTGSDPNVLLVVMDSVRAANVSLYGHENDTTPFLSSFADGATVFEQARSPGSWSLPSHASIFTGYHVEQHRITEPGDRLATGETVFEALQADGYDTGVFSENPWLTTIDAGLDAGFDVVEGGRNLPFPEAADPVEFTAQEGQGNYLAYLRHCREQDRPVRSLLNGVANKLAWDFPRLVPDSLSASSDAATYVDRFLEWTAGRAEPWAACINFMDAHAPYEPGEEHDAWGGATLRALQRDIEKQVWSFHGEQAPWWQCRAFSALYDGAIRQMDAAVDRLVGALRDRGVLEDTLIVITSDHGEGFGEPSRLKSGARVVGHVEGIHESLLHVPLVMRAPGQSEGRRVSAPVSLTRFPAAVAAVRDGDDPVAALTGGQVLASSHGLTEPNMRLAEQYCEEDRLPLFRGTMRTVYEEAADGVEKFATWRDAATHQRCVDARTTVELAADDDGVVDDRFADLSDVGVRITDGLDDIDGAARRRLEELGYV